MPKLIDSIDNPDPMGRPCYKKGGATMMITPPNGDHREVDPSATSPWNNNYIQFARLLSEICAEGIGEALWDGILEQMGIESDDLSDLLDRAQDEFEREKRLTLSDAQARWGVQHQMDDEPTYLVDLVNDPDGDNAIEFPAALPWQLRLFAARMLALILNTDGRYCHPEAKGLYEITDAIRTRPQS